MFNLDDRVKIIGGQTGYKHPYGTIGSVVGMEMDTSVQEMMYEVKADGVAWWYYKNELEMLNCNYDTWSREELLCECKRLSTEVEKVKRLKRLTDDRFLGKGYYEPKTKAERKEIQNMYKPSYAELYERVGIYERMFETEVK